MAVDRHWTLVEANASLGPLLDGIDPSLLAPPLNVLRLGLHPLGLAPRIVNLAEWRDHLLGRLRRQVADTADPVLGTLLEELSGYPSINAHAATARARRDYAGVVVPLELETPMGVLAFFSTVTVFGTPLDVTLSELVLESFYPADAATATLLRQMAEVA